MTGAAIRADCPGRWPRMAADPAVIAKDR